MSRYQLWTFVLRVAMICSAAGANLKEILRADSYTIVAVDRTAGICLDDTGIAKRDDPDLLKLLGVLKKGGT